nr:glycosyltransferase family 2 protein [Schaalia meyeri]
MLIVIPAWNEEAVLGDVLEAVKAEKPSFADILVVSDGSVDATASIARAAGVAVLDLPLNLGVGGAMRAGFQYARRSGYQYACQLDADGQHDPGEIETLIDTASREGADVVIGSRFAGKGNYEARGPRKWAMNLFSFILSRVCHTRLSDTTSGFKLYGPRALSLFARNYPAEYLGDTIGALVIAARSHLVVREVGVQMHPRAGGEPSHNPIKSALFLVRASLALVVSLSRPGEEIATASEVEA